MSDYVSEPLPANEVEEPAPVEEPAEEEPAEEEPVEEEPAEEEPVEEEAHVEEEPSPVEQVASEIREILTPIESVNGVETSSDPISNDNLCSLKTLIDVLGKWSGGEIRKIQVEDLLKEGTGVDENLDDLEKVVEILQLWRFGGSCFRKQSHILKLDEYELKGGSKFLSDEKKVEVLKTLTELVVNVSHKNFCFEEIKNILNNLY